MKTVQLSAGNFVNTASALNLSSAHYELESKKTFSQVNILELKLADMSLQHNDEGERQKITLNSAPRSFICPLHQGG